VGAEAETAYKQLSKSSKISGRVLGGNAKLAGKTIGDIASVRAFIEDGATFNKDNLGVPLSYRLRELGSNETFKTVIYSKYLKNDSGNIDHKKLDFNLLIKEESLKSSTGSKIEVDHFIIERINPKSNSQGNSKKEYFNKGELSKEFLAFEKGEKIHINVITKNKKRFFFKIDAFAELVQRAQSTPANTHMYDLNKGNGLQLKDENNNILTIGIHNQKLRE
jgi:hemolysin